MLQGRARQCCSISLLFIVWRVALTALAACSREQLIVTIIKSWRHLSVRVFKEYPRLKRSRQFGRRRL